MRRREFIKLLVGMAAAWPLVARAARVQQQPIRPLIGFLSPLSAVSAARNVAAFRSGLRNLGYLEGRDTTLALRFGDGEPERTAPLAQELVALKPDVLLVGATSGALAAQAATRTIPLVTIMGDDPVALGVAQSIARPGGNITGTWFDYDALAGTSGVLEIAVAGVAQRQAGALMIFSNGFFLDRRAQIAGLPSCIF